MRALQARINRQVTDHNTSPRGQDVAEGNAIPQHRSNVRRTPIKLTHAPAQQLRTVAQPDTDGINSPLADPHIKLHA